MSDQESRPDYGPRLRWPMGGIPVDLPEMTDDQRHTVAVWTWEARHGPHRNFITGTPVAGHRSLIECSRQADAAMAALIRLGFTITPPKPPCKHGVAGTAVCADCVQERRADDYFDEEYA